MKILAPNLTDGNQIGMAIVKIDNPVNCGYIYYKEPCELHITVGGNYDSITCTSYYTKINQNTTIQGNLSVSGTITGNQSNTTITHYCPIEEPIKSINDFVVGAPVYLTGKVYKYSENTFMPSSEADTIDCICLVKTNGKWNEFVGICVKIDEANKCITFATHVDYLVRVTDTSCYGIGDEVFIDDGCEAHSGAGPAGSDGICRGELKTLTGQTAITSKIRRTTVGIITAKINDTMLAVFKS